MEVIKHKYKNILLFTGLILILCSVYYKLIYAGYISWDDADYVFENKDVQQFNFNNLITKFYIGNYHPITMLNYALDWKLFQNNPLGYHLENLVWHLLNSILIYVLFSKLIIDKTKVYIALLVALVFAFHPIQVESVAWIAERKNVLALFFALISTIKFIQYLSTHKNKYIVFSFLFFSMSLLSKSSYVLLPFVFLALDWYFNHTLTKRDFLIKIPYLILSLLFIIITIKSQKQGGFINDVHDFPLYQKIGLASYAIIQYIYHFLIPTQLSVIYPYPQNLTVSIILGYSLLIFLVLLIYKLYKNQHKNTLLGIILFIIPLIIVLQIIPFGEVLTADRYMYFALTGLSFILFTSFSLNLKQVQIVSVCLIILLGCLSFKRVSVWENGVSLYSDILKKYPHSYQALNSIGAEYMLRKEYKLAESSYNKSITENPIFYKTFYNRALLYSIINQPQKALTDYAQCIKLNNYYKAYVGRANLYYVLKDYNNAMQDAETALLLNPNNSKANFILANCYDDANELQKALYHYNAAFNNGTPEANMYLRRGILYGKLQKLQECLSDIDNCIALNPNYGEAYYWKGVVKVNLKQNPCLELKKAQDLGFDEATKALTNYCN